MNSRRSLIKRSNYRSDLQAALNKAFDIDKIAFPKSSIKKEIKLDNAKGFGISFHFYFSFYLELFNQNKVIERKFGMRGNGDGKLQQILKGVANRELLIKCLRLGDCRITQKENKIRLEKEIRYFKKLISDIPSSKFCAKKVCHINPSFPSCFCQGDIIIDDTLIEIKITNNYRFNKIKIYQLLLYYCAYRMQRSIKNIYAQQIKFVAFYFPIQKVFLKIKISNITTEKRIKEFIKYLF